MDKSGKIFVTGHRGMFGGAVLRLLKAEGYTNLITATRAELDLLDQAAVNAFFKNHRPQTVVLAAAKVGGIFANLADPLSFIRDNLIIQNNVFDAAHKNGAEQLLFLGSSCIYPTTAPQPLKESAYLSGPPEPTNQSYAIAKFAGLQLCAAHNASRQKTGQGMQCRAIQPPNLYGVGDHFGEGSHALSGMLHRMHHAKLSGDKAFTVWGTGNAKREWMDVADAASAALHALQLPEWNTLFYNTGTGEELSMRELAEHLQSVVGYTGHLVFDTTKPEGMARKLMDSAAFMATGWQPKIGIAEGLKAHYAYYLTQPESKAV